MAVFHLRTEKRQRVKWFPSYVFGKHDLSLSDQLNAILKAKKPGLNYLLKDFPFIDFWKCLKKNTRLKQNVVKD